MPVRYLRHFHSATTTWRVALRLEPVVLSLHVPGCRQHGPRIRVVADEAAIVLAKPFRESAVAAPPENIVVPVAVEVAGSVNAPAGRQHGPGVGVIADEPAVRLPKPLGESAVRPTPDDVVAAVAVEVAGSGHLPTDREVAEGIGVVADDPSTRLAEPVRERAVVVAPDEVAASVPVEVVAHVGGGGRGG